MGSFTQRLCAFYNGSVSFYRLRDSGLLDIIDVALVVFMRLIEGRREQPSVGIIDSQSAKTTESGSVVGYYAGKKIKVRKHHIITDSAGNLLDVFISSARIQDRKGAVFIIDRVKDLYPLISKIYTDGGYVGE